jgi:hypothetical protein
MKALDDPYKRLIRHNAMAAVRDPEAAVRKVSGIVITTIVSFEGLKEWPDLIDCLGANLDIIMPSVSLRMLTERDLLQ